MTEQNEKNNSVDLETNELSAWEQDIVKKVNKTPKTTKPEMVDKPQMVEVDPLAEQAKALAANPRYTTMKLCGILKVNPAKLAELLSK